jgi:hypothetical protein
MLKFLASDALAVGAPKLLLQILYRDGRAPSSPTVTIDSLTRTSNILRRQNDIGVQLEARHIQSSHEDIISAFNRCAAVGKLENAPLLMTVTLHR